jgi:sugar lactone lactonase YvrE
MDRRVFLGSLGSLIATTTTANRLFGGQAPAGINKVAPGGMNRPPTPDTGNFPKRDAKVTRLFKTADGSPNGLEASPEGVWIGEEITERAVLQDWKTGKVLRSVDTEAHNTSGIAVGGGYIWMGNNGRARQRAVRPTDSNGGGILQLDLKTGKTVKEWKVDGGQHGLEYDPATNLLWATDLAENMIIVYDPKQSMKVVKKIPAHYGRGHGLAKDKGSIWVAHTGDFLVQRLDENDGHVMEQINLPRATCGEVHGLCMHDGYLHYGDAGVDPAGNNTDSIFAGCVVRIDNTRAANSN